MTHFILRLVGISSVQVRKAGDFTYLEAHDCLCYQGREIPVAEFNDLVPKVMERYKDYLPRLPQVVLLDRAPVATPRKAPTPPPPEPAAAVVSGDVSAGEPPLAQESEAPAATPSAAGAEDTAPEKPKGGSPQKYAKGGVFKS